MKLHLIYTISGMFLLLSNTSCNIDAPSEITALQEKLALETARQNSSISNSASLDGQEHESESNENEESNENVESIELNESSETNVESQGAISDAISQSISTYVSINYGGHTIEKIKVESNHIEVELSNGVDLVFDSNGNFLRLDD